MTKKVGGKLIIEKECSSTCEMCGEFEELRPYGPNGENICFKCGMENKETTDKKYSERLLGTMH